MLEVTGLKVTIGRRQILSNVTLQARPREVLSICGPNGAGKSTLLRAALGEIAATGRVTLNGHDLRHGAPHELARIRAVVPQDTAVAFPFTVAEIIEMGLESGSHATRPAIADRVLAAVGLSDHGSRDIQTLSGGERQRVQLARALAQVFHPVESDCARWLFLDEPVPSLDLGHQMMIMQLARSYADHGGGVVMVMHDLNLAARFSDRIAFMTDGQIAATGAPDAVMSDRLLSEAFGCTVAVNSVPQVGPWLLPQCCESRYGSMPLWKPTAVKGCLQVI